MCKYLDKNFQRTLSAAKYSIQLQNQDKYRNYYPDKYMQNNHSKILEKMPDKFSQHCIELLENHGVGYYAFMKEIEIILQTLKIKFPTKKDYVIRIDKTTGLNMTFSEKFTVNVHYVDFNGAEYDSDNAVYDSSKQIFSSSSIDIYIKKTACVFKEGLFREMISHEFNHAVEDWHRHQNNAKTLRDVYDDDKIDIQTVMQWVDRNNKFAQIIYRYFIDTEMNALVSQLYSDLNSIQERRQFPMKRSNFKRDIEFTDTYKLYKSINDDYQKYIYGASAATTATYIIKYFPKWSDRYRNAERSNRKIILEKFFKWFKTEFKYRRHVIWIKFCKVGSQFYDDIESGTERFNYDDILPIATKLADEINETLRKLNVKPDDNRDEIYSVVCEDESGTLSKVDVRYNPDFEYISGKIFESEIK